MTSSPARAPLRGHKLVQLVTHSAALRTALRRAFAATPYSLGVEETAKGASRPDALVLDIDGTTGSFALLEKIAHSDRPARVIAILAEDNAARRREALERGATVVMARPCVEEPLALRGLAEDVVGALARIETLPLRPLSRLRPQRTSPQVLLVASSTGGPQALMKLFANLPPSAVSVPVLVVQHMPPAFTAILAEHLTRSTAWRAAEARADEPLVPGEIRIAPGGHHMLIGGNAAAGRLKLSETPPVNFCRPSADVLFFSAAEVFGRCCLAVILTGMGSDGCEGAKAISASGGTVLAQDRASSVVWGMPGAAYGAGVVDRLAALEAIAPLIRSAMTGALA